MFSFHKPKVYRSSTGCCICKAKSSSSRFTDSKKYEEDFIECFKLEERRSGEICNACVLLVKRWKKLPPGSDRNWRHVVDARAGPGIKSLTKFKSKNKKNLKEIPEKFDKIMKKKHVYVKVDKDREQSPAMSDDMNEEYLGGTGSKGSSRAGSPACGEDISAITARQLRIIEEKTRLIHSLSLHGHIDLRYFKRETASYIPRWKGDFGEIILDPSSEKCSIMSEGTQLRQQVSIVSSSSPAHSSASGSPAHSSASASPAHSVESAAESTVSKQTTNSFTDSSSDSGYDESSNQGLGESNATKLVAQHAAKPGVKAQPARGVQMKGAPVSVAVTSGQCQPIKLVPLKDIGLLAPAASITLSGSTSRSIVTVPSGNPLVDLAVHATSARESFPN